MGMTLAIFHESVKVVYRIDRLNIYVKLSGRAMIMSRRIRHDIPSIAEDLVILFSLAKSIITSEVIS